MSSAARRRSLARVRLLCTLALMTASALATSPARADKPGLAFLAGASVFLAGFAAGSVLTATGNTNDAQNNAGWLTIEAGFALAPIASHAVAEEWTRGLVFTAPPAAALAGTATLFALHPATIEHGELAEQRVMWSLFGLGVFSSILGVVDSTFADRRARAVTVAPLLGSGQVGLRVGGTL
jgi:hypothetical protein